MRKAIILTLLVLLTIQPTIVFAFTPTHLFTDQEKDLETGLYNYGSREYDPNIGKFLQQDPVLSNPQKFRLESGEINPFYLNGKNDKLEKFLENPQNLNPYSYTKNNPVIYIDPSGELQVHFAKDATEEEKKQFYNGLNQLINQVQDKQEVIDYFKKFNVDIVETLSDDKKGPDVYVKRQFNWLDGKNNMGIYNNLTNNIKLNLKEIGGSIVTLGSTLIHELGHWANDISKRFGTLNPEVDEYGLTDYIKSYVEERYPNGKEYFKHDKIYGFLAEMLTFGFF